MDLDNPFDEVRAALSQAANKLMDAERDYRILINRCVAAGMWESENSGDVYGRECVVDLCNCNPGRFHRESLKEFFETLCDNILEMERHDLHFWDDVGVLPDERQVDPKKKGTSAVQFIMYSTVVVHCLDDLRTVFLNVFSCKDFDADAVERFACEHFEGNIYTTTRKIPRKTDLG